MKAFLYLAAILAFIVAPAAFAVPGTYTITPNILQTDGTGGSVTGYRIYQGCDVGTQTKGALVADNAATSVDYVLTGDSATPPVVCAVAFNSAGEGAFANAIALTATQQVPGPGTIQLSCQFSADTGEIYNCSGVVQ